ncbi:MAG TPA: ECF-type sigma factor [Terriglobales bacterium]|nr:ECF-type sigma factor [Terriglobales bacterium]
MARKDVEPGEITVLLRAVSRSEADAEARLYQLVYTALQRIAASQMRAERPEHTLSPTALVHEAWLRLANKQQDFENRHHFLAAAAKAMRCILVDYARARYARRRGGVQRPVPLEGCLNLKVPMTDETILVLDEALQRLAALSARAAQVVEMRFFAGLTESETAGVLGVTRRTVNRDWEMARVWLYGELKGERHR